MSLKDILQREKRGEILLPLLKRHLAHEQRLLETKQMTRADVAITDAEMTLTAFAERKASYLAKPPQGEFYHPSSIGRCMRQLWYWEFHAPENGNRTAEDMLKKHMTLEMGTYTHVMFQNLCEKAGFLKARELEIQDREEQVLGHGDGKLRIPGKFLDPALFARTKGRFLLEIKTINPRDFGKLSQPHFDHKQQATAYMKCLRLKAVIFIYIDTDRKLMKEFLFFFDEDFYQEHCRRRSRKYFRHIREKTQPDREGTGNPRTPPCCWCPFTTVCYSTDDNARFLRSLRKVHVPKKAKKVQA